MGNLHKTIAAGGLMAVMATASAAESPFSANVALTSDYAFRGISQTQEESALQGGFDFAHGSGFYVGLWGSNVNFAEPDALVDPTERAQLELDVYAGISGMFGKSKLGWDVGVLHYDYPGASSSLDYAFNEVYGKLSYDFGAAAITLGVNHSNDYFAASDKADYYYVDASVPLPQKFALSLHAAKQNIKDNGAFGTPDYKDYKIGVSREIGGFGFDLSYIDTDLSESECFGGTELCNSRVVFTISKAM